MILNLLGAGPQTIHICHKHQKLGEHNYFDTKIPKPLFPTVSNLFHKKHKHRCVCPHFHFFSMIFDVLGARPQTIQICHKHQKLRKHCYFATRLPKPLFFWAFPASFYKKYENCVVFLAFPAFFTRKRWNRYAVPAFPAVSMIFHLLALSSGPVSDRLKIFERAGKVRETQLFNVFHTQNCKSLENSITSMLFGEKTTHIEKLRKKR